MPAVRPMWPTGRYSLLDDDSMLDMRMIPDCSPRHSLKLTRVKFLCSPEGGPEEEGRMNL